jgi:DnaJ-class molecular chaperone/serine/threonine protein kinase
MMKRVDWNEITIERKGSLLGQGHLAFVLKGKWKKFHNKIIALKILTQSMCEAKNGLVSFEIEAEHLRKEGEIILLANQKGISNIIHLHGFVEGTLPIDLVNQLQCPASENDQAFGLLLEYIESIPLSLLLYPKPTMIKTPLALADQIHILVEISLALAEMHSSGIIHGDLKPQNVLLSLHTPPLVKLIDFGLSNIYEYEGYSSLAMGGSVLHDTTTLKGTRQYCAPEMLRIEVNSTDLSVQASRSTDMYAFGILAWEISARKLPFSGKQFNFPQCVLEGIRPSLTDLPSNIPQSIINMITSCWHNERTQRKFAIECMTMLSHEHELIQEGQFDIFFSHAWANKPFLSYIYRLLVKHGFRVWYDMNEMGHDLCESMIKGITNSKVVLVCLNSLYMNRENCLFELNEAKRQNKVILTLIIESGVQYLQHEVTELCQLKRKFWIDVGAIAVLQDWYNGKPIRSTLLTELNHNMEPLFHLLKKVSCLPDLMQQQNAEIKCEDIVHTIKVSLEDLYNGKTVRLAVSRERLCPDCDGRGTDDRTHQCKTCKGKKTCKDRKVLNVIVEKGMSDGEPLLFPGEADENPGMVAGDVIILLKEKQHDVFRRMGSDLIANVELTLSEALCGFKRSFTHLDGRVLMYSTFDGQITRPGSYRSIEGEGMPCRDTFVKTKGDLFVYFVVKFSYRYSGIVSHKICSLLPLPSPPISTEDAVVKCVLYNVEDIKVDELSKELSKLTVDTSIPLISSVSANSQDIIHNIKVSLDDFFNGKTIKLAITRTKPCYDCRGTGMDPVGKQCRSCQGKKTIKDRKVLEVIVEKGMCDGDRLLFAGEGDENPGMVPGDVVLVLKEKQHDVFRRVGSDLIVNVELTLSESFCGFERTLTHLDQRILGFKNFSCSQFIHGGYKSVPNEGMPVRGDSSTKGSLYILFSVKFSLSWTVFPKCLFNEIGALLEWSSSGNNDVIDDLDENAQRCHLSDVSDVFMERKWRESVGTGDLTELPPIKDSDISHTIRLTLEDFYHGKTVRLAISRTRPCTDCCGVGNDKLGRSCSACQGKKTYMDRKVLEVIIKKGMCSGERLTFRGEGDERPGMFPGDVILMLEEREHASFLRVGSDLIVNMELKLNEALCGCTKTLTHLDERLLSFGLRSQRIILPECYRIVPGEGMYFRGSSTDRGGLIIHFTVKFPDSTNIMNRIGSFFTLPPSPVLDGTEEMCFMSDVTAPLVNERKKIMEKVNDGMTVQEVFVAKFANFKDSCKSNDIIHSIKVSLESFYHGSTVRLACLRTKPCLDCSGLGVSNEGKECKSCTGKKTYKDRKVVEVNIEKGMCNGDRIIFPGEGDEIPGTSPGGIIIILQEKEHEIYQRMGNDLLVNIMLQLSESGCGFTRLLEHLDARRKLLLKIPSGSVTLHDSYKTIKGKGMPSKGTNSYGDLFIHFTVTLPRTVPQDVIAKIDSLMPSCPTNVSDTINCNLIDIEESVIEERKKDYLRLLLTDGTL